MLNLLQASVISLNNYIVFSLEQTPPPGLRWANTLRLVHFTKKEQYFTLCFNIHTFFSIQHCKLASGWALLAYHYTPYCEEKIAGQGVNIASCLAKSSAPVFQHVNLTTVLSTLSWQDWCLHGVCICVSTVCDISQRVHFFTVDISCEWMHIILIQKTAVSFMTQVKYKVMHPSSSAVFCGMEKHTEFELMRSNKNICHSCFSFRVS